MGDSSETKAIPYVCGRCGAEGQKLWRLYQAFLDSQELTCYACTCDAENRNKSAPPFDITYIGWRVAAVPTPDKSGFWGYTSVPQDGVDWWHALPPDFAKQEGA